MRHAGRTLVLLMIAMAAPLPGGAEVVSAGVAEAAAVRVTLFDQSRIQGYLRGRSADEIVVYTPEGQYRRLGMRDVRRFEMRGRAGHHLKRGAALGALLWLSVMATSAGPFDDAGWGSSKSLGLLGGSVVLGGAIGSRVPRLGWQAMDPRVGSPISSARELRDRLSGP